MKTPSILDAHERDFVRHPTEMPIRVHCEETARRTIRNLSNIGIGGLACRSDEPMPVGSEVTIEIPLSGPPFRARGAVRWCRSMHRGYELGIQFIAKEDAFAARMVEQLCHIERYRRQVKEREGRDIDSAEAAIEWINIYATRFPEFNSTNIDPA